MIDLQLCHDFDPSRSVHYPVMIEPKLDGIRAYCENGLFFSRNHKPLHNVSRIGEALKPYGMIFDGEIMSTDWNETVSVVHTHVGEIKNAVYFIFDMLTPEEVATKKSPPYIIRAKRLRDTLKALILNIEDPPNDVASRIQIVPTKSAAHITDVDLQLTKAIDGGLEGIVIKDPYSEYAFRRHRSWTKLKPWKTEEFEVVGIQEGTGKYEGMMGALMIRVGEITCGLGTGFSDEQRKEMWSNPPVGKTAEVRYQEKTKDHSLRFPSFLRLRTTE